MESGRGTRRGGAGGVDVAYFWGGGRGRCGRLGGEVGKRLHPILHGRAAIVTGVGVWREAATRMGTLPRAVPPSAAPISLAHPSLGAPLLRRRTVRTPPARPSRLVSAGGGVKRPGAAVCVPDGGAKGVGVAPTDRRGHQRRARRRRGRQRASVPAADTVAAATWQAGARASRRRSHRGERRLEHHPRVGAANTVAAPAPPPVGAAPYMDGGDSTGDASRAEADRNYEGGGGESSRLQGRPQAPPVQPRVATSGPRPAGVCHGAFAPAAPAAFIRRGAVARRAATLARRSRPAG